MTSPENESGLRFDDLERIPLAARRIHGYHMYRAFNNFHGSLLSNLEKWYQHDLIDSNLSPKYKSLLYFFIDRNAIKQVTTWYLYLYFSHEHAARVLNAPVEGAARERVLYLRGFDAMNVFAAESSGRTTAAGMVGGSNEWLFRHQLEEAVRPSIQLVRIISPKDHYWDTSLVESVADESFYGIAEFAASRGSLGIYTTSAGWMEQVSRLIAAVERIVVCVPSPTPSVLWEISEIRRQGKAANCLIVIPHDGDAATWNPPEQDHSMEGLGQVVWEEKRKIQEDLSTIEAFLEHHHDFRVLRGKDYEASLPREVASLAGGARTAAAGPAVPPFDVRGAIPHADLQALDRLGPLLHDGCRRLVENGEAVFPPLVANWVQHAYLASLITQDYSTSARCMALLAGIMNFYADVHRRYFLAGNESEAAPEVRHAINLAEYTDSLALHLAGLFLQIAGEAPGIAESERSACAERLMRSFQRDLDEHHAPSA